MGNLLRVQMTEYDDEDVFFNFFLGNLLHVQKTEYDDDDKKESFFIFYFLKMTPCSEDGV